MGGDVIFFLTIIISSGTFLSLLLAITFSHRRRTQLLNAQIDFQNKMIERLGSGSELRAHLESEILAQLVQSLRPPTQEAWERIVPAVIVGCVLAVIGIALLCLMPLSGELIRAQTMLLVGTLVLAAGIGFLLAAFAAYRILRSWGLLNSNGGQG